MAENSASSGPGWQEDDAVLALWDQRRHFGGWGMICLALIVLEKNDLLSEGSPGSSERATISLERLLERHGSVPPSFKEAYFRDRLSLVMPHAGEAYDPADAARRVALRAILARLPRTPSHQPIGANR